MQLITTQHVFVKRSKKFVQQAQAALYADAAKKLAVYNAKRKHKVALNTTVNYEGNYALVYVTIACKNYAQVCKLYNVLRTLQHCDSAIYVQCTRTGQCYEA